MDARTLFLPIRTLTLQRSCCLEPGAPVVEAIHLMREDRFECVLVVDKQELVGIVTDRDLLVHIAGKRVEKAADVIVDDINLWCEFRD